jgi:hypothetical protein
VVARRGAGASQASLRVGPGRHRLRVVALDRSGTRLGAATARLRATSPRG